MLFAVKNYAWAALAVATLFAFGSYAVAAAAGIEWRWSVSGRDVLGMMLAVLAIGVSDGLLHGALWLACDGPYLQRYRELAEYFRPQRTTTIVCGGVLAGAEELMFRGLLLELALRASAPPALAVLGTASLFGLLHLIPRRALAPFAVWAIWEGVLLGVVYLATHSMLVSVLVHALHDMLGFALFRWQRRTGWLLGEQVTSGPR